MKKLFNLLAFMIVILLASCSNEGAIENSKDQSNLSKSVNSKYYYDKIYQIRNGKEVDITNTQLLPQSRSAHEFYEISSIQPTFIYLGAILSEESINRGVYRPIASFNETKPEITISFSLPVHSMVIAPKKSTFSDAIAEAIGDKNFTGRQSQVFTYKMKQFTRYSEVKLAFGANVNIGQIFSIDTQYTNDKIRKNTAVMIDFSQIYFNVAMDMPDDGNIFRDETIRQKYLLKSPVYINSVNYGRQGIILVESEESYQAVSLAIRAAFNAKIINGEVSLDEKTTTILNNSEINICIIGGDGGEAAKTVRGLDAFKDFIINGGVYTREVFGIPVSFSGAYASDNSLFVSQFDI